MYPGRNSGAQRPLARVIAAHFPPRYASKACVVPPRAPAEAYGGRTRKGPKAGGLLRREKHSGVPLRAQSSLKIRLALSAKSFRLSHSASGRTSIAWRVAMLS